MGGRLWTAVGAGVLMCLAWSAGVTWAGQGQAAGGAGLTIYADPTFRGRSATLRADTPNLETIGMNDMVSSVRVAPGEQWEVCEHANYQGRCVVLSESDPDLRRTDWNDMVSSARRVRGGSRYAQPRSGMGTGLELFSAVGFSGERRAFTGAEADLRRLGFNDAARSLRIGPGQAWDVCVDINFEGCRPVTSDWSDLNGLGMSGRISSVRPTTSPGGRAGYRGDAGYGNAGYLVLYESRGFAGQRNRIDQEAPVLSGTTNRVGSVEVRGGSWQLCDRPNFNGRCVVVAENVGDLATLGLRDRVGSARPMTTPASPGPGGIASMEGTRWRLVDLAGRRIAPQDASTDPQLVFEPGGRVSGADGCTRVRGGYQVQGDQVRFGQLSGTGIGCSGARGEIGRLFQQTLASAARWRIAGDRFELFDAAGRQVAVFSNR